MFPISFRAKGHDFVSRDSNFCVIKRRSTLQLSASTTTTILGIRQNGERFAVPNNQTPSTPRSIVSPKSAKSGDSAATPKRSPGEQAGRKLRAIWDRVKSSRRSSVDSATAAVLTASLNDCDQSSLLDDSRRISVCDSEVRSESVAESDLTNSSSIEHLADLDHLAEEVEVARKEDDEADGCALAEVRAMLTAAVDPTFGGKLPQIDTMPAGTIFHRQQVSPIKKRSIVESVPEDLPLSVDTNLIPLNNNGAASDGAEVVIPGTTERLSSSSAATTDSALSSQCTDSRRGSSIGLGAAESGVLRPRRMTVNGKLPHGRNNVKPPLLKQTIGLNDSANWQNVSADSQFDENLSDEDLGIDLTSCARRMSVDERTLRSANYAILRKQNEYQFQLVGTFCRNEPSAYRSYLQSQTVYDILPPHGIVFMISDKLSIRKAIHAICSQTQTKAAITSNPEDGEYNIFTLSDVLHCLQLRREDKGLADMSVQNYFDSYQTQKRMVVTGDITSVWDVARLFRMNHVHRIPVVLVENFVRSKEVIGVISLRPIFVEIAKLTDSRCTLKPNLKKLTLKETQLGKRSNLSTDKISCLPLINSNGNISGALGKIDIMNAMATRGEEAIDEIMETSVKKIANPNNLTEMLISAQDSISDAIHQLIASHHQCLLIANEGKLEAVVSYADIMDFLVQFDHTAR
ncbi:5'-AMP-activated protein kinase subunit gamma-1 [Aphelenchoides besseyi]|nr:5'-AMP-activated protein kinase subunit gamma-1 [Aphelenchoides besseyi]